MSEPIEPTGPLAADVAATFARLSRRRFLRVAGVAAAAGVLPAGCRDLPPELVPPPDLVLGVLSPRGYATFRAVAMRMVGPRGAEAILAGAGGGAGSIDPARAADRWALRVPALAGPLAQGLWLLEWGLPPLLAKWRPFTALDGAEQDRVLDDCMRSRLDLKRDLFKGLRSLALLTYYADPAGRAALGLPQPFDAAGIATAMGDLDG